MLKRIRIENYRSIGKVDIELGPLTVLVGQNGSGKTNFVDAIHFLSDALTYGLDAAVMRRGGIDTMRNRMTQGRESVSIEVELAPPGVPRPAEYSLELGVHSGGHYVRRESLATTTRDGESCGFCVVDPKEAGVRAPDRLDEPRLELLTAPLWVEPDALGVVAHLRGTAYYAISPDAMREPHAPAGHQRLDADGSNLASVLRRLGHASRSMAVIRDALGAVVPQLRDIEVRTAEGFDFVRFLQETTDGRSEWLNSRQMSDGTLRVLGVLAALYQRPNLPTVILEEPELTVHPGMLAVLRDVIVEASQKRSQVIITTHSPDLMNLFDVDVLRVVEMTDEGTKIGPVAEYQRDAVREKLFLPGDLARIEGLVRAQ